MAKKRLLGAACRKRLYQQQLSVEPHFRGWGRSDDRLPTPSDISSTTHVKKLWPIPVSKTEFQTLLPQRVQCDNTIK